MKIGEEGIVGQHVLRGERSDNGERMISSCEVNNMVIMSTMFPHRDIHKQTWISPDGKTKNQIDHICINTKFKRSIEDVRVYRDADAESDHYLQIANVKLKLAKIYKDNKNKLQKKFDTGRLKCNRIKEEFAVEVKNRFEVLEEVNLEGNELLQCKWNNFKNTYNEAAESILGFKKRKNKPWIKEETWTKIEQRNSAKKDLEEAIILEDDDIIHEAKKVYDEKAKEVKQKLQQNKRVGRRHCKRGRRCIQKREHACCI